MKLVPKPTWITRLRLLLPALSKLEFLLLLLLLLPILSLLPLLFCRSFRAEHRARNPPQRRSKLLNPHQKQVITIKFAKAGSYYFLCTVPRHAEQGMAGSFVVKLSVPAVTCKWLPVLRVPAAGVKTLLALFSVREPGYANVATVVPEVPVEA